MPETYEFRESAWYTIERIGDLYHQIYRLFRKKYKWPPSDVDGLHIMRITRIFNELVEDIDAENDNPDEDEFD